MREFRWEVEVMCHNNHQRLHRQLLNQLKVMRMIHFFYLVWKNPADDCLDLSLSLLDPNKEGQNVFNIIPQQDLYDPWGRPGGGAPLVHPPTGQKFTRYSGSLQEKLVSRSDCSNLPSNPLLDDARSIGFPSSRIQWSTGRTKT